MASIEQRILGTYAAVLSCHRCLINTGVEKIELHLNIDQSFDHQKSLSKNKCWYSNNCLHFKAFCSFVNG